jgi:hypothetical protein
MIEATFQNHSVSLWYVVAIRISRISTEWHPRYLLATEIQFVFKEVKPANIPAQTVERYGSKQLQTCFDENKSTDAPEGPTCAAGVVGGH